MCFQNLRKFALLSFFAVFLSACGSGGGGGSSVTVHTGTLTVGGKTVEGANFSSTGGLQDTSGTTAANGQFTYTDNSTVQISIGSTVIGSASAASLASGLAMESLLSAYQGNDPVILDLASILADSSASTPHVTLPSDFADLNPVKNATLTVNGKPVSGLLYITAADPNAIATRNIVTTNASSNTSGNFEYDPLSNVTFKIGNTIIGTLAGSAIPAGSTVTLESLIAANSAAASNPTLTALPNLLLVSQGTPTVPDFFTLPATLAALDPVAKTVLTLGGNPISGIDFSSGGNSGLTTQNGVFDQDATNDVTFTLAGLTLGVVADADLPTSIEALAAASTSTNPVIKNLPLLLTDLNAEGASNPVANFRLSDLEQAMFKPDTLPENRLLGMNLETPQAEADGINQPLITADIFRIARPFQEASCEHVIYNPTTGWPIEIPAACAGASTATPESKYAYTQILRYSNNESIPVGTYTVLYDGIGSVHFSGMGCNRRFDPDGVLLVDLDASKQCPHSLDETDRHNLANVRGLEVSVTSIDAVDPIRNIRIIMPGGICKGAPFTRVDDATACGSNPYISFAEVLKANRNAIVFNPDYLNFAKDFRVLRMMNLMEASPRRPESYGAQSPCPTAPTAPADGAPQAELDTYASALATYNIAYNACVLEPLTWAERPTMDDINWGGSSLTSMRKRQGVPLEVGIALANLLKAHPWLIIPHNADDIYISEYAKLLADDLDESLVAHIEYSNEVWNSGFWGHQYNTLKGAQDSDISAMEDFPFRDKDYSNRVRYYAKRATKIFQDFGTEFGDLSRLKRILGGQNKFPAIIANLLSESTTVNHTDAVAIAPYFHGCWAPTASNTNCGNVTKTISDAQTVDDLFTVMDSLYDTTVAADSLKGDPDSLDGNIKLLAGQIAQLDLIEASTSRKIDLYAYEGGQHLTIKGTDEALKTHLLPLIEAANRDPRMKERYETLLTGWKNAGGKLFALFTAPQTFNRYGSFGIKETLNSSRASSPKFDGAMTFEEGLNGCWLGYAEEGCP